MREEGGGEEGGGEDGGRAAAHRHRRHTGKERPHAQRRTRDLLECLSTGGRGREGRKGGMDEDGERSGAMPPRP